MKTLPSFVRMPELRRNVSSKSIGLVWLAETYHRANIGMRHGIKLVEPQLEIRANIDIRSPVLRHVAVLGSGKD